MTKGEFETFPYKGKWMVVRKDGVRSHHCHLKNKTACCCLVDLIDKRKMPKSKYLQDCVKRLLTEKEFEELKQNDKPRYYNHNPKNYGRRVG